MSKIDPKKEKDRMKRFLDNKGKNSTRTKTAKKMTDRRLGRK